MAERFGLLPPMRWRFLDADDITAYGDRWWPWDEPAIGRLRGRELIALEETIGMPMLEILEGFEHDRTLPKMAAMWISMHREGHPVKWHEFNPIVLMSDWEVVEAAPLDSGAAEPTPDSPSSPEPATESATS